MIQFSAHLSMLFRGPPYLSRPAAARDAGFAAIETWWPPDGLAQAWAEEVRRLGVSVALLNCYCGDIAAGERGWLNISGRRQQTLRDFRAAVVLASFVGAPRVNLLPGRLVAGVARERQLAGKWLRSCATAQDIAETEGITIVVEQINELDIPGYVVPSARDVAALIDSVGSPSVRMLYDAYHAARSGVDPLSEAPTFVELIDHVHYADYPGRGAPGTGTLEAP